MEEDGIPFRDRPEIASDDAVKVLQNSQIEIIGRMAWSSNSTYLVDVLDDGLTYKEYTNHQMVREPLWIFRVVYIKGRLHLFWSLK
ncbi:MAG: hypothetical protein CM15mP49_31630 [Actinomycetota bacterium]|nr:MAG: hypothetical protein CM15mP49_31630 [Actinomycetota bacterium]